MVYLLIWFLHIFFKGDNGDGTSEEDVEGRIQSGEYGRVNAVLIAIRLTALSRGNKRELSEGGWHNRCRCRVGLLNPLYL